MQSLLRPLCLFSLIIPIAACTHAGRGPLSSTDVDSARAISLIASANALFSSGLVPDVLHSEIDEGYRFTQIDLFGEKKSRSVFAANGTFTYTILKGFPSSIRTADGTSKISSSDFGDEEINQTAFQTIADAFAAIDLCSAESDRYDPDHVPNDQGSWSYEAVVDGQYCFVWFDTPPKSEMSGPAVAFDTLFNASQPTQ